MKPGNPSLLIDSIFDPEKFSERSMGRSFFYNIAAPTMAALILGLPARGWTAVKNPDVFTSVQIGDVDSLDPAWSYDTSSHEIIHNVYELLLDFKGASLTELEPALITQVPDRTNGLLSSDGLTYTFPIRKGVKFHDGTALTPEDVKYSLMRFMLYDRDGGPSSLLLDPIIGLDSTRNAQGKPFPDAFQRADKAIAVHGDKVSIRLAKPYAPFLSILANYGHIASKSWCIKNGSWDGTEATWIQNNNPRKESSYLMEHANGTGPFMLERWDKRNKETVLVRSDHYWRKPARLKRVIIKGVEEFATRKLMLQAGDADTIYAPQMMFPQLANLPGVQVFDGLEPLESPTAIVFTFKLNPVGNPNIGSGKLDGNGIPPDFFSDRDVRKAFAFAVDREAYVRDLLRGKGRPARGLIPKGMLGYDPNLKPHPFDLAKATEHFKKAWGGRVWEKGFQFTLMYNDTQPAIQALASMIKKNIESLNPKFKVDIRTVQWSSFLEQTRSHKIPMFVAAWQMDYPDPHNMIFPYLHSKGDYPVRQGYRNDELDRLIEQAVTALDPVKRDKLYRHIQGIEMEEMPHILIAEGVRYRAQRTWVKGWIFRRVFPNTPYGSYYYDLYKGGN